MKTSQDAEISYSDYLNSLTEPIITTDIGGLITSCNKSAEKLLGFSLKDLYNKCITDIISPSNENIKVDNIIQSLNEGDNFSSRFIIENKLGASSEIEARISALIDSNHHFAGTIITFRHCQDRIVKFHNLEMINKTLAHLGDSYEENINSITALCGELLGATCALYNRLENNLLCSFGKWNTPADYNSTDSPDGHICFDVIKLAKNEVYFVKNLDKTQYAKTDSNVKLYGLKTYIGHMVRANGIPVGSLCAVFTNDIVFSESMGYLMNMLALALEGEETRESLRKSKNRYSDLFNFAAEGIMLGSPDLTIIDVNRSICKLTGFEKDEIVGKKISDVLFTKESLAIAPFETVDLEKGKQVVKEREIRHKDGHIITIEMQTRMMPDRSYQTVLYDITAKKQAENKLLISESTYKGIINSLTDAVYILNKDAEFLDVNHASEIMYNYKKEEFIGKTPEFLSAPGKNDLAETVRLISEAYNGNSTRFDYWGLRKDGSVFPKEVTLTPGLWFGEKAVIALGRDLTESKKNEELLRLSEEKYRLLVQYSSDPIFSYNIDETYRFVNDAFAIQFGKTPEELIGKSPFEIFSHEEAEKRLRLIRHIFKTAEKGEIEVKVINAKNETKYYLTMADPIKDETGKVLWVTCISKEITLRKQAEEELRQRNEELKATNAEKDKFFSIVAHDLRGPMNGFLGLTGIMAEDIESLSAVELKEIANTMRTSAVNIYRLIENLLEWSRLQRGVINFEPQPMFLKSSLNKSIELVKDTAEKKEIKIEIKIPEHMVVSADLHMLETVIRNLLSNAIKFSLRGSIIEISAFKTEKHMICIEVKDNGIGIPVELRSKLFSIAESTSRKGTENEPSTGLGLILCKEFVEKQGGKIEVESTEGEGSIFRFTVPQL